jgi:O-antigen/teichoic acid export membrane protein
MIGTEEQFEGAQALTEKAKPEVSRTSKVLALSLGRTLTTLASVVFGMVAARLLSKHDYATMRQTMLAYNFVAPLLMLGLPEALYYFLPRAKNREKGVLVDNLFLLVLLATIFSIFLAAGGYKILALRFNNPDLGETLKWMIPYPLYVMPAGVLGAVLLTKNKTYTLAKYNVISSIALTSLTIVGILITRTYTGPLLAQIFFPLLLLPIVLWLCFRNVPGKITKPNLKSMREMVKYAVPLGLAGMISTIMLQTNKIIVSAMCTPEEFANYVNGAFEIPLIGIITMSISSVILVDMTKYVHQGDKAQALELFKKASTKSALILFPAFIFLLISGKSFIVTLYSEKYLESIIPFYIYLFVLPMRIVIYGSALMALGQSRVILIRSIFDLIINILLSIVLVHFMGYLGAAVATIVTLYVWTVPFNLYKIGQGFEVKPIRALPFNKLGKMMLLALAPVPITLVNLLLPSNAYLFKLLLTSILYFPIAGGLFIKFGYLEVPRQYQKYLPFFHKNKD